MGSSTCRTDPAAAVVPIIEVISVPMTMMTVPNGAPMGTYRGTGCCADSCASAATYDASNDRTAKSGLRKRICKRHHHRQSKKKQRSQYSTRCRHMFSPIRFYGPIQH